MPLKSDHRSILIGITFLRKENCLWRTNLQLFELQQTLGSKSFSLKFQLIILEKNDERVCITRFVNCGRSIVFHKKDYLFNMI